MKTILRNSILVVLFAVLALPQAFAGSGVVPTAPKAQNNQPTQAASQLQPQAEKVASVQLQEIPLAEQASARTDATKAAQTQPPAHIDRTIRSKRGGFFAGMMDWFSGRKLIKKAESKASAKSPLVAGMVRLGIILMVIGLAVMVLGIVFDGSIGGLFYSLGALCFVVGLVLLILGLVGVI